MNTHILSSILVERFKLLEFLSIHNISFDDISFFNFINESGSKKYCSNFGMIPIKIIYITDITFLSVVRDVKL